MNAAKVFVGGLPKDSATEDDVRAHFSTFGEVAEVDMKYDAISGLSRGFCFVVFSDKAAAEACLSFKEHSMAGKWVEVKSAQPSGGPSLEPSKVFIGNLRTHGEDEVRALAEHFGNVTEIVIKVDPGTGEPKGFGFVTFDDPTSAAAFIENGGNNYIGEEQVNVQPISPKLKGKGKDKGKEKGTGGYGKQDPAYGKGGHDSYGKSCGYGQGGRDSGYGRDRYEPYSRGRGHDGYGRVGGSGHDDYSKYSGDGYGGYGKRGGYGDESNAYGSGGAYGAKSSVGDYRDRVTRSGGSYGRADGYGQERGYGTTGSYGKSDTYAKGSGKPWRSY